MTFSQRGAREPKEEGKSCEIKLSVTSINTPPTSFLLIKCDLINRESINLAFSCSRAILPGFLPGIIQLYIERGQERNGVHPYRPGESSGNLRGAHA